MKFLTAVALVVTLLWLPVDGVAQTEAQRSLLESYESREEQLLASMDLEADEQRAKAARMSCDAAALADAGACIMQAHELEMQQIERHSLLQREVFEIRWKKLELDQEISQEAFDARAEKLELAITTRSRASPQPSAEAQNSPAFSTALRGQFITGSPVLDDFIIASASAGILDDAYDQNGEIAKGLCRAGGHDAFGCLGVRTIEEGLARVTRADTDWDWDQFYDGTGILIWRCRGIFSGRFAENVRCASDLQSDDRWPKKRALR
jgi:hypothetical protein